MQANWGFEQIGPKGVADWAFKFSAYLLCEYYHFTDNLGISL